MTNEDPVRLLLVDDEVDFLAATSKALTRRGFIVHTASSAEMARIAFAEHAVHAVVLDVKLTDGDGHQLFYEFQSRRPEVKIIMLTGHGTIQRAFEMSRDGLFDYLTKPVDIDYLAAQLRLACTGQIKTAEVKSEDSITRVLLVDDEKDFLEATARVLARRGIEVLKASCGKDALDMVRQHVIDVAVVDVKMPDMNGLEVMARIKKENPRIEVVLLTGHATVDSAIEGMSKGAFDYLFKPHDPDKLAQIIHAAAQQKRGG